MVAEGRPTLGADWRSALDSGMLDLVRAGRLDEARELLQSLSRPRRSAPPGFPSLGDRRVSVVVIGLNHRSTPLDLLERMTIGDAALPKALHDLISRADVSEAVVLSTCNRTEVYAVAERFHGAYQDIRNFLAEVAFLAPEDFSDHLYVHYDAPAVAHLFGVAAGLDSAVLGESEILGQVKVAWERARQEGAAGPALNLLFRHALEAGKRARTDTGIARNITSVSQAAVAMAAERLGGLAGSRRPRARRRRDGRGDGARPGQGRHRAHHRQPHLGHRRRAGRPRAAAGPCASPTSPPRLADVDVLLIVHRRRHAAARGRRHRAGGRGPRRAARC